MNSLFTLNIKNKQGFNGPFVTDRVRRSFISACYRWGCNYSEINHEPDPTAKICNWGKLLGPKLLIGYESLLYLDGDMIISEHAPNPFDLCVKNDVMYAVVDAQGVNQNNEVWKGAIYGAGVEKILERFPEFKQPSVERYFNTGFMMFRNTPGTRDVFQMILENRDLEVPTCYDQTVINLIVHNTMGVEMLPEAWNYIVWEREKSDEAYINHFIHAGPSLE
jgi:lipopolysaccharide biosynthesis glycosyltransferase